MSTIVSDVTASVKLAVVALTSLSAVARPITTKANSPPGPSRNPVSIAAGLGTRNSRARPKMRTALTPIRPATHASSQTGSRASSRKSIVHADGEEEHAEQQALERLDGGLDGLAILGLRQQQAGNERSERHGQPGQARGDAGADDHEQDGGDEQLAGARRRHQAKQGTQQQAADDDDESQGQRGLRDGKHDAADDRAAHVVAEYGYEHEDRHDGHVLGEQDGEAGAAGRGRHAALAGQDLDDDGGGRQRQARPDDHRGGGREAGQRHDGCDDGRATARPAGCRGRTRGGAW